MNVTHLIQLVASCVAPSRRRAFLFAWSVTTAGVVAAEAVDPAAAPVALVDGKPIALRQVEDAMLRKEGAEAFEDWVHTHLAAIDWTKVGDDDPIIVIAGNTLTRRQLALNLLKANDPNQPRAGDVRENLIDNELVEQALAKEAVVIGPPELDAAWAAMEREFQAKQKNSSQRIDFASYIQAKQGMAPEVFRQQAGFRMFAGLRLLAIKRARAELSEEALMRWFDQQHDRYDQSEAVELADIYIPYRPTKDKDGKEVVDEDERQRLTLLMFDLYKPIRDQQQRFEITWAAYGRNWDAHAGPGGKLGWVRRDGTRETPSARPIPAEVMGKALAASPLPALLQPIAGPTGVDLVRVDGHRAGKTAAYADVRERVLADLVEAQLDQRMGATMEALRRAADIKYKSLPDLIDARAALPGPLRP